MDDSTWDKALANARVQDSFQWQPGDGRQTSAGHKYVEVAERDGEVNRRPYDHGTVVQADFP